MTITRLPLAVPTEPRDPSLDKDALLKNCFIDTDPNTNTLYAVKRPGLSVGLEGVTTGLSRGIWWSYGKFYHIDETGAPLEGTLPSIPGGGGAGARYVTSTKDYPTEGNPNSKVSYFNKTLSEFNIGDFFDGSFVDDGLVVGTNIALGTDKEILGIVNTGPGTPLFPKPVRNILYNDCDLLARLAEYATDGVVATYNLDVDGTITGIPNEYTSDSGDGALLSGSLLSGSLVVSFGSSSLTFSLSLQTTTGTGTILGSAISGTGAGTGAWVASLSGLFLPCNGDFLGINYFMTNFIDPELPDPELPTYSGSAGFYTTDLP